jgi:ABC-type phosphate transport system substrate-binding protein
MRNLYFMIFCSLIAFAPLAYADLVVVANPKSGIERLTQDEVINIYLGRYRRLASGIVAEPVDLAGDSELRARFYRRLVGKTLAEINAYWARLIFSGRTRPPQVFPSPEAALRHVAANPDALAYVDKTQVQGDKRVLIVFELAQ